MTIVMMEIKSRYSGMVGTKVCIKRELAEEFDTARINIFLRLLFAIKESKEIIGGGSEIWEGFSKR